MKIEAIDVDGTVLFCHVNKCVGVSVGDVSKVGRAYALVKAARRAAEMLHVEDIPYEALGAQARELKPEIYA